MLASLLHSTRANFVFLVLVGFLGLCFLIGGGARDDIQSLAILRPAAAFALGLGCWALARERAAQFRFLLAFLCGVTLLVALHLVPLPPGMWSTLPGREIAVDAANVAGVAQPWRPLSLAPFRTWNSLYSLLVPMAVLLLAIECTRAQRFNLLWVVLLIVLASGLLGLLQAIGPTNGPLYFYRITNNGSAVGLFANRNHQAVALACLFPILATYASTAMKSVEQARIRGWVALGIGAVLIPLILVTGSRAGLFVGLVGIASVPFLYSRPTFERTPRRRVLKIDPRHVAIGIAVFLLALLTGLLSRARALERLVAGDETEDLRLMIWKPIFGLARDYLPLGSGMGSFVEIYQIEEPGALLATAYVNHAHNDLLEVLVTGGLPALLLILVAVGAWTRASWLVFRGNLPAARRDILYGKLGSVLLLMLALASLVDYPLRVPSLSALCVVAAIWLASALAPAPAKALDKSVDRRQGAG